MTDKGDGSGLAQELSRLTKLRDSGALSLTEYEEAKAQLLGHAPPAAEAGSSLRWKPEISTLNDPAGSRGPASSAPLEFEELELDQSRPPAPPSTSLPPPPPSQSPPPDGDGDVMASEPPPGVDAPQARVDQEAPSTVNRRQGGAASTGSIPRVVWLAGGAGVGLVVLLVLLVGLRGRGCGSDGDGDKKSSAKAANAADDNAAGSGGVVRWRPGAAFSCGALQDRVDGSEEDWVDQLELLLKSKGILLGKARISADRPHVAVKQAQTLVFERGELHRCQVAQKQRRPEETQWLKAVQRCFKLKKRRRFTLCHVKAFLQHIGQLPFSCRFYCNKEMYQCGAEVVASSLRKQRGFRGLVDDDRLDKVRPKLFASCLRYCKEKIKGAKTREAILQCMFQPTCKGFVSCLEELPEK